MRKALIALALIFALAFGFGALSPAPVDASPCYYTCSCTGAVLYCCGTACKPAVGPTPIQCPQIITC